MDSHIDPAPLLVLFMPSSTTDTYVILGCAVIQLAVPSAAIPAHPSPSCLQTIDLRSLLLSIHAFFEALGVDEIRRRSHADDKPLRMVKTILHELCKLKGTDIYR